jgi:hypothetical protein
METLKDLAAAAKGRNGTVIDAADRATPYSYDEFGTNSFKAGNLLGHYGVHPGGTVAVVVGPKDPPSDGAAPAAIPDSADPLLALFGGVSVGATVDLTPREPVDARALVRPDWQEMAVEPQCSVLAYGGPPTAPSITHFEQELWSENPTEPPEPVESDNSAVRVGGETFTHAHLLAVSRAVVESHGIDETSRVLLATGLAEPGALVAGVLAPLVSGGTILLPSGADDEAESSDPEPTLVVRDRPREGSPEPTVVASDVTEQLRDTRRA